MASFNRTLNLAGFTIKKTEGLHSILHAVNYDKSVRCIHGNGDNLRKKARYERLVRHESIGFRQVSLKLQGYKYYCRGCGKYFRQVLQEYCHINAAQRHCVIHPPFLSGASLV